MNQKRKEIAFWDEWSKTYEEHYILSQKKAIVRLNRKANLIMQSTQMNSSSKILEVGCGTGVYTSLFTQTKADLTAIDISPQMIAVCKKKPSLSKLKLLVMDAEQMSFKDNTFDIAIGCYKVFHEL